jgi:hypothetical protein
MKILLFIIIFLAVFVFTPVGIALFIGLFLLELSKGNTILTNQAKPKQCP